MRLGALFLALLWSAGPAAAHGFVPIQPSALWQAWSFDPLVLVPLLVAHWAYGRGTVRLWARAGRWRGIGRTQVVAFLAGEAMLVVTLVSPLDQLGGTLLSAHMAQHAILIAVAPPLLLLGRPGVAFAWAFPARHRGSFFASRSWRALAGTTNALSRPIPAASLHGLALWAWHAPAAFDAALASGWLHALEHASFFGTALLFWRALGNARSARQVAPALGAAFFTLVHGGLLGALISLAPRPLYGWYGATELWGLSTLEDQQLAGLLMWVPMGGVYFATCLYMASRLIAPDERYAPTRADLSRIEQRPS
ncbi:MAG: cytochrome c oxidase assembly protein [Alphaproteobacteria bacterium]